MHEPTADTAEHTEGAMIEETHARVDDRPSAAADTSMAVAVVPKQRIVATSNVAIWDTAAFDHMGRVGALMASSMLASPTIYEGVDERGAVARMVMIANLARECGANPLMFLQGCSIISNKLHLEGKIVAAIITARTGIKLRYRFGVWKDGEIAFPEAQQDGAFFKGAGDMLAVRVEDPADPDRFVDGYVALWKTERKGSPWAMSANWKRQLRYRGAPEWARAYEPGAVLGFYSDADEDLEEFEAPKPRAKRDLAAKLSGKGLEGPQAGDAGFDRAHVANGLGDGSTAADANSEAQDADFECVHEFEGDGEDRACKLCGQLEADARPTTAGADTAPEAARTADGAPATSGSAGGASEGSAEAKGSSRPEAEGDGLETPEMVDGAAPFGEQYFLFGDAVDADGRRLTYQNGVRFSSTKSLTKFKAYTEHSPEKEPEKEPETEDGAGLDQPCEACGAPAGEPCADDCPDAVEAIAGGEEAQPETGFLATLTPMKSWADEFKPALAALFKTSDYQSASDMEKDELRRAIWAKVIASGAKVDQADDPSAYGLWLAAQGNTRDDADAVEGTFNVLQRSERWLKMTDAGRKPLLDRTAAKLKSIRGSNG